MFKSNTLLKLSNLIDNLITFAKIQQIGAYKTLANITGSTANLSEVNIGYTPQGAVTLSGNVTYAKSDFAGRTHLLLSTNNTTTRTFTVSNTGFVDGDFICLLIDQNSSGNVSVTIGTRSISGNRGNIINGLFDGTNWHVWSGGGVFNTSSSSFNITSFGLGSSASNTSATSYGRNVTASGDNSLAIGQSNTIASGTACIAAGSGAVADIDYAMSLGGLTSSQGFARHISFGGNTRARRYGATRTHLRTAVNNTDNANPSLNGEKISWTGNTTNDTITELFLRGVSSNRCVLQAKNTLKFRGQAVAFRSDYSGSAGWDITGLIKRDGSNNTTLAGVTATLTHSDGTGNTLVLTITADDTNEALRVQVTGNASETWTWGVELELLDLRIA
jgi:hypothetical protein